MASSPSRLAVAPQPPICGSTMVKRWPVSGCLPASTVPQIEAKWPAGRRSGKRARHASPQHVGEPDARLEIIAVRRGALGVEDRARLGDHLQHPERAGIGKQRRVGQRLEDHLAGDHRAVAAGVVGRLALLRVAAEVDAEALGRNGDRGAPDRAVVLLFLDAERAVRQRSEPGAAAPLAFDEQVGDRRVVGVDPIGRDQLADAVLRLAARRDLRPQIALHEIRQARVDR